MTTRKKVKYFSARRGEQGDGSPEVDEQPALTPYLRRSSAYVSA
jgi:hypothetical protein